jgi:hypothetical protein
MSLCVCTNDSLFEKWLLTSLYLPPILTPELIRLTDLIVKENLDQ